MSVEFSLRETREVVELNAGVLAQNIVSSHAGRAEYRRYFLQSGIIRIKF